MITVTMLTVCALGVIFAPGATRAILRALSALLGTLAVAVVVFWRIFPSSSGTLRRF
jgi:hypothetical protein